MRKARGRWNHRENRKNEYRAMSDEELEKEYEKILADNDEAVAAGDYEYGDRYDVRPSMQVWKDGVRMEDTTGGMTGYHADALTDLETVMEERSSGTKPFVLRTATPREKDAKSKENTAEIRRLIGQPDSKYPLIEDMHHTHRDTGERFGGVSIEDEMTVRRLEDENEEINLSFPHDYDADLDPDQLRDAIGQLAGDGGAQVVDPSEVPSDFGVQPSSATEDPEWTMSIYDQALRRYQTMNDEDLAIERGGLWRKTMRWREAGHEPRMADQLKLSAATNEIESRGTPMADEVEGQLPIWSLESPEDGESYDAARRQVSDIQQMENLKNLHHNAKRSGDRARMKELEDEMSVLAAKQTISLGKRGFDKGGVRPDAKIKGRRKWAEREVERQGAPRSEVEGFLSGWEYAESTIRSGDGRSTSKRLENGRFTEDDIIEIHGYVDEKGRREYRTTPVTFANGTEALSAELIPRAMKNLIQAHKDGDLTPEEFVEEFLKIHPFEDGNGRTASILLNALEWQQKGSAGPDRMFFSMLPKFFEGE